MFGNLYFYLNRHHTTAHRQRDARVALASNFKGKMHSQQKHFTKCMTEMFALNYVLRFSPLMISGTPVERVSSFKYPRCKHLRGPDLDCTHSNTGQESQAKTVHLRQLRKFRVSPAILKTFYSGAIESVLTQCISVWYSNATNQDCKALQRVVRLAE